MRGQEVDWYKAVIIIFLTVQTCIVVGDDLLILNTHGQFLYSRGHDVTGRAQPTIKIT